MAGRVTDSSGRRKFIIEITEKGTDVASKEKKAAKRVNNMIKEGFTDKEIDIFKKVLSSIFINFSETEDKNGQIQRASEDT